MPFSKYSLPIKRHYFDYNDINKLSTVQYNYLVTRKMSWIGVSERRNYANEEVEDYPPIP